MHQPTCICEKPLCPGEGARFYVTVKDHDRTGWLLGPYDTHEEALTNVERGKRLADGADPRAHWYAYGTARIDAGGPIPTPVFGR